MNKVGNISPTLFVQAGKEEIDSSLLCRIGAGHDGFVYKYSDEKVLKILKYDALAREGKGLMTYRKALRFVKLSLTRITQPIDLVFDSDGVYVGYVMKYLHDVTLNSNDSNYRNLGSFVLNDLFRSTYDLERDVNDLSSNGILMEDLNPGSYIITDDYLHMCDMDKFRISDVASIYRLNNNKLNFFISKWLYLQMYNSNEFTKEELKQLLKWVKCCSNSFTFLNSLEIDCLSDENYPVNEYAKDVAKRYLGKK